MDYTIDQAAKLDFKTGIVKARGHIVFVFALLSAFGLILSMEGLVGSTIGAGDPSDALLERIDQLPLAPHTPLTMDQRKWGHIAWRYFQNNIDPVTGLVNATDKYQSTTMWDAGSFFLAMIAAERTGVIDRAEFDRRTSLALASLARLPLFDGALPNKAYNTHTLEMVDYDNHVTNRGIGWSALDIGRLFVPLGVLIRDYPGHSEAARRVVARWDVARLASNGILYGGAVTNGQTTVHQEGRVGYEEYAAKSFIRAGVDAFQAWRTDDTMALLKVGSIKVPVDTRSADDWGAQVYSTSEPYILDGLEFGFDKRSRALSEQLFKAQEERFERTGIVTAVSEGHIDRAPYFLYDTVRGNGDDWAVLTDKGDRYDELRTLSTKTAFALDAVYGSPYTSRLIGIATGLSDPKRGWLEGRYEKGGKANTANTANTNGIVLESLHYRAFGPIVRPGSG
jgi:hypothetical protein